MREEPAEAAEPEEAKLLPVTPPAKAKAEEPKADEPKAEEPKAEEPKAEEPKAEAPTTADASTQTKEPTALDMYARFLAEIYHAEWGRGGLVYL